MTGGGRRCSIRVFWIGVKAFLIVLVLTFFLFPYFWMFINSIKTSKLISSYPPVWWFQPRFGNFVDLFTEHGFLDLCLNTLIVAFFAGVAALLVGLLAAYSIVEFRQRRTSFLALMLRVIPYISFLIPWFIIFMAFRLTDTYLVLITVNLIVNLPLSVWIMVGFFENVPSELKDAAMTDGCTRVTTFWRIAVPLVKPGLIAVFILSFIFAWNNFMFPLVLAGPKTTTLPLMVWNFITYGRLDWAGLSAASTLMTLPALVLIFLVQRYVIRGFAAVELKG